MLISHDHDFIFLKTRKTAGTSVEMVLQALCTAPGHPVSEQTGAIVSAHGVVGRRHRPRSALDRLIFWRKDWYNHMPAAQVSAALGADRWNRYRKVATVRSPFDLAVSRYHFDLERQGIPEHADFARTRADFAAMLQVKTIDCDHAVVHLDGSFVCDEVIRFEALKADTARVAALMAPGVTVPQMPHTKKTTSRRSHPVAEYFDDAGVARIRQTAAWVFARFDYPDDPRR